MALFRKQNVRTALLSELAIQHEFTLMLLDFWKRVIRRRSRDAAPNRNEKENEMRKFLIVVLGLAGVGVFAEAALAEKFELHMTMKQLENGCLAGNGHFDSDSKGYSCVTAKSTIQCSNDGRCVLTDHMILTRPTNNTHGPVAQGGNKVIGNPGNTTGATGGPANAGNTTSAGAGNATNAGAGNATGASTASSTTKSGAFQNLGAAFMSNGRPRTQER